MIEYSEFLASKQRVVEDAGIEVYSDQLHPSLFPFQRDVTRWALRKGANGELDNETWIEWANGIWLGISESDTLSYHDAREGSDEKHICPLQLGTIERCIKLYSNPGELLRRRLRWSGASRYTEALMLCLWSVASASPGARRASRRRG